MREELVAGLSRDHGGYAYAKWRGAFTGTVEAVDWRGADDELLTGRAREVLAAAGRL